MVKSPTAGRRVFTVHVDSLSDRLYSEKTPLMFGSPFVPQHIHQEYKTPLSTGECMMGQVESWMITTAFPSKRLCLGCYAYARLSRTLMRVAPRAGRTDARTEMTTTIPSQMKTAVQLY